jgi:chromosome segregation ATPase
MGWIVNFLEKIGLVEVETAEANDSAIHINDLEDWTTEQEQDLIINHKLKENLLNYINKLKDKRWMLECKLDDWEKKIHALGLDYRSQDVSVIFNETRKFLEILQFENYEDFDNIQEINKKVQENIDPLQRKINESAFSYNYSFILSREEKSQAMNPLLKELLEINNLKSDFSELIIKSGFTKISTIKENAKTLDGLQEKIRKYQADLKVKQEKLDLVKEKANQKQEELESLRDNPNNLKAVVDKNKREEVAVKKEELADQVIILFSKVKPALELYAEKNPNEKLINDYLSNSADALFGDEGLAIISVLRNLKNQVISGELNLVTQQNDTLMGFVGLANSGKLEELREEYKYLNNQLIEEFTPSDKDFVLKLEEARYRLEHFSKQVEKIQEEVEVIDEEINNLFAVRSRNVELFKNLVRLAFGKEIEIKA